MSKTDVFTAGRVAGSGAAEAGKLSRFAGAPDRPVFVGACPRSGTTLLRAMLNSHPELALPHETRIIVDTWKRREEFGDLSVPRNRRRIARWLLRRKVTRAHRLGVGADDLAARMKQAPPTLGSVLGTPYLMYAEQQDKPRWGDKRPHYAQHLDVIFTLFPDAQFINVVRDPRASVASIRKIGWYQGNVVPAAELWDRSVRAVDRWRRRLAPDQLLEIQYEDLVADPEAMLERVCAFLNLDGAGIEAMLSYHRNADTAQNKFFWRVARPVTETANRGWEEALSREEVAFVEWATGPLMRRYGYQAAAGGAPVPKDLRHAFRVRRREKTAERWRRVWHDSKLRFTYRRPVAARLTSAQRSLAAGQQGSGTMP